MKRKHKIWMCSWVCTISIILNSFMVSADGPISSEEIVATPSNYHLCLSIDIGDGVDAVGYVGDEMEGFHGPQAFAVEGEIAYILDTVHSRINVYDTNGWKYNIDLTACADAEFMKFQENVIGVVDNQSAVTGIYSLDGQLIRLVYHPADVDEECVAELSEIGKTYVIWRTFQENYYLYDWVEDSCELVSKDDVILDAVFERMMSTRENNKANSLTGSVEKVYNPLGVCEGNIIYEQYEYISDVDMFLGEFSVRKVSADGQESYAIIDTSEWYAPALSPFYMSTDGRAYVMENLEDCVKISAILFNTTDTSRMPELEEIAEVRRVEMKEELETYAIQNTTPTGIYKRYEAFQRAKAMADLTWTVLSSHKVVQGEARLHSFVGNAADNSTLTGIPYCWGGFNGIDDAGDTEYYKAFCNVVTLDDRMAGDINTDGVQKRPKTIGLDCSGYVSSAYGLTTKYGTGNFRDQGHAVAVGDIKMSDYLVSGSHVVLVYSKSGTNYVIYECSNANDAGKVRRATWTVANASALPDGYNARSFYCITCNTNGATVDMGTSGHTRECTGCGYSWKEAHTYYIGFCTVCGHAK